jgi:hypothetical protein
MNLSFPLLLGGSNQTRLQDTRVRGDAERRAFLGSIGFACSEFAASQPQSYSPASLHTRTSAQENSGVPERFVAGQGSESVLKITKRPRLRPEDVSHRRCLGIK